MHSVGGRRLNGQMIDSAIAAFLERQTGWTSRTDNIYANVVIYIPLFHVQNAHTKRTQFSTQHRRFHEWMHNRRSDSSFCLTRHLGGHATSSLRPTWNPQDDVLREHQGNRSATSADVLWLLYRVQHVGHLISWILMQAHAPPSLQVLILCPHINIT